jgi:amino acid adenylation domain-containing protein
MLSVIGVQMHNYSGEDDLNIGLPVTYRPHSKLENIFGMFVNTVVVRLKYEKEYTFRHIIRQSNTAALNAIAHQDLPFEKVVEIVNPGRSSKANPLFQVGFTWQNNLDEPLRLDGIRGERIIRKEWVSIFDIGFYMWENGNHIEGMIEYNVDILKSDTMIRLRDNLINLVQSIVENPDRPISDISVISESDKKKVLEFNNTDTPYEHDLCIHQKFEMQAKENPDLPALLGNNQSISYKELNDHANRMAHFLISRGVNIEDKVAVCIDRSMEMMICIFGILKAGAAYLPLSPENPTERLKSIINDADPKLILTSKASSSNIPEGSPIVFIDDIISEPLSTDASNPNVKMTSRNLAYVLYTSGSTGTPKGVMIEHHSVLNRLGWMQKAYPIDKNDTLLQKTPITFDVSVWELFWWFFNGAKLVMLPKGGEKDPEVLVQYIENYKVTTIHFVPSMFATFFETLTTLKLCEKLESLSRIFLSGEALPLKLVKEFNEIRESYTLPDLINLYGPTEATVDVSYYNCPRNNIKNVYIGKPIDNTKLFVVNGKNILQPVGVPGELLITGVNLARGYLNRPDLTSEKFFDFRISDDLTIRAYHTGDLVRFTPDEEIDYMGRLDNQIKIRGFRIELGDIEAKILEHQMVTHCAVIVTEKGEHKYLVAYVCLKPGNVIDAENLRNYLSGKLPDYMVPPYIIFMDTLPLTSSGKLNRKSLPVPDRMLERNMMVAPSTENEKRLLDLWKDLLKVENISINDNFFDVGGNSLLAINLANMISKEFTVTFKALMIFEFPSIKDQSEFLSGKKGDRFSLKNTEIDKKIESKKKVTFKRFRE